MSSTVGSPTITGWKRRSSAASFSMCLRYSSSVVAPIGAQLAAREHRLEQVGGVDRALGGARADDRVQLVDEQDDLALGLGDLLEHGLEALLELAAVLRAGDQRADVERDHAPVAQRLGHVAGDDPLGEALDDRGLAHAGLADQHRVVLRAPREHLDHAADLVVAADHRVELALARQPREVAAVAARAPGTCPRATGRVTRCGPRTWPSGVSTASGRADASRSRCRRIARQGKQQVLGGDVLVAHLARVLVGATQQLAPSPARARGPTRHRP